MRMSILTHFHWFRIKGFFEMSLLLTNQISYDLGIFLRGWAGFFKVILMSLIMVENVILMINFDEWDRLGHVWTIFDAVGLFGAIFHWHICEDFASKWANLSISKDFISKLLMKALKTLKFAILRQNLHKYANEGSILTTQRRQTWFKHVPIGPNHQN